MPSRVASSFHVVRRVYGQSTQVFSRNRAMPSGVSRPKSVPVVVSVTAMSNLLDSLPESFYDSPIKASVIPGHVPASLVVDFDYHADPAFLADPFAGLDRVRDRRVFFSPRYDGYWVLTQADDIRAVFQDPATFSSADIAIPKGAYPRVLRPLPLDPPGPAAH